SLWAADNRRKILHSASKPAAAPREPGGANKSARPPSSKLSQRSANVGKFYTPPPLWITRIGDSPAPRRWMISLPVILTIFCIIFQFCRARLQTQDDSRGGAARATSIGAARLSENFTKPSA